MSVTDRIAKWVRSVKFRRGATEVRLRRQVGRNGSEPIQTFDWPPDSFSETEVAREVWEVAGAEANAAGGRAHSFTLTAFGEDAETPLTELTFRLTVQDSIPAAESETDDPAIIRQLMRHNEAMMRLLVGSVGTQIKAYESTVESLTEQVVTLERQRAELAEEATGRAEERLLLAAQATQIQKDADADREMGQRLMKWGELATLHILRKQGALTQGVPPALKEIIGGLQPAQVQQLLGILTEEQAAKFGELYLAITEEMEAQ